MIQINLLPWREQARKEQQTRFGIIAGGFAALGLLFVVIVYMHYSGEIRNQTQRNRVLQQALDQANAELTTLNKKKKELIKIDDELNFTYKLKNSSYDAVRILNELALVNPETITLNKIIRRGNVILIIGKAATNLQITQFMDSIEESKYFFQPVLTDISGKESKAGQERTFQLRIVLRD